MLKLRILICIVLSITSCTPYSYSDELQKALGISVKNPKIIYNDDEIGGLGEGYSISVIEINDDLIEKFVSQVKTNKYPLDASNWQVVKWKRPPVIDSLSQAKELTTDYFVKDERRKNIQNEIEQLLKDASNTYYSFYYKERSGNIVAVQFFVVDVESKKLYIVKSNI